MGNKKLLADLYEARELLDRAIEALETADASDESSEDADETSEDADESKDLDDEGTVVPPCPACGAEFDTIAAKLDHARDAHGVDI